MISAIASAPGKCILVGEHAVVYGAKAIVIALNLRAYASIELLSEKKIIIEAKDYQLQEEFPFSKKNIVESDLLPLMPIYNCCKLMIDKFKLEKGMKLEVWSEIPSGAGLGSSAAVSVATIKAVETGFGLNLTKEEISQLAFEVEKTVHTNPSGIDNFISTFGGCILYSRKEKIKNIKPPISFPLIICDSQKSRQTGILVEKVANLHSKFPKIVDHIFNAINLISNDAKKALENGNLQELGELFNLNQGLLESLGVSNNDLSNLINIARENGAFGAKLTGAGGGGCIIAVSSPDKRNDIILNLQKSGGAPIITEFSKDGLKIENLK